MDIREELREKLRKKLNNKQKQRHGKTYNVQKIIKANGSSDSNRIFQETRSLMEEVAIIRRKMKSKFKGAVVGQKLKPKYPWLYDNYFPIYRATIFGEMNLNMLVMFLEQKQMIENKEITQEACDKKIGNFLGKKYNVDMEKLEKDLKEKYGDK
jgi:hypothetical protein